jgi:hypothetical protein
MSALGPVLPEIDNYNAQGWSFSNEPSAVIPHPVEPRPPLPVARRIDRPQQGLADALHPGKLEDAVFQPAHSVDSEEPWVYAGH